MVSTGKYDFNFPMVTKFDDTEQEEKVKEEFVEFYYSKPKDEEDKVVEALDLIHAVETWLRMECTEEEIVNAYMKVFVKNALRGYYDIEKDDRDQTVREMVWNNDDDEDDEEYAGYYKHHGCLSTDEKQTMVGDVIKPYVDSYQLHAVMTMVKYIDRMGEKPGEEAERAAFKAADYAYRAITGEWINELEDGKCE